MIKKFNLKVFACSINVSFRSFHSSLPSIASAWARSSPRSSSTASGITPCTSTPKSTLTSTVNNATIRSRDLFKQGALNSIAPRGRHNTKLRMQFVFSIPVFIEMSKTDVNTAFTCCLCPCSLPALLCDSIDILCESNKFYFETLQTLAL